MSPLPAQFTDRWGDHREAPSFQDAVCWHLLLGDQAPVRALARDAQQRLARFSGLHLTPLRWLHVTVFPAGSATGITEGSMNEMLSRARLPLSQDGTRYRDTRACSVPPRGHRARRIAGGRTEPRLRSGASRHARGNRRGRGEPCVIVDAAHDSVLQHQPATGRARHRRSWQGAARLRAHHRQAQPGHPARPGTSVGLASRRDRGPARRTSRHRPAMNPGKIS